MKYRFYKISTLYSTIQTKQKLSNRICDCDVRLHIEVMKTSLTKQPICKGELIQQLYNCCQPCLMVVGHPYFRISIHDQLGTSFLCNSIMYRKVCQQTTVYTYRRKSERLIYTPEVMEYVHLYIEDCCPWVGIHTYIDRKTYSFLFYSKSNQRLQTKGRTLKVTLSTTDQLYGQQGNFCA